ncbi:hypothetical protein AURDEDRAFT_161044 [Auricularia subglabra TFB-10046 SS5]|nr:hypothetical protein AURDEDRAFT_161044 [Auricularia subglabra TFB-10046 SS5]
MAFLPHLRRLSMYGNVGAEFFALLARPAAATQQMLVSLRILEIHHHYMIEDTLPSLLAFLKRKLLLAPRGLQSLRIYPPQAPITTVPPLYSTALSLSRLVGEAVGELKFSDRDVRDVLQDVSYWLPSPHLDKFMGTTLKEVLLCQILSEIVNRTYLSGALGESAYYNKKLGALWRANRKGALYAKRGVEKIAGRRPKNENCVHAVRPAGGAKRGREEDSNVAVAGPARMLNAGVESVVTRTP